MKIIRNQYIVVLDYPPFSTWTRHLAFLSCLSDLVNNKLKDDMKAIFKNCYTNCLPGDEEAALGEKGV